MGNEPQKHSRLSHLTGVLAACTALVAAVSTLYVNMRSAPEPSATAPATPVAQPAPTASVAVEVVPPAPTRVLLRLDRLQVENDGSLGTTDWIFEVSAAGQPRFTLPMRALNDKPGRNLARPADPAQAAAELVLAPDQQLQVTVKGWKDGFLPGSEAEVGGSAWISGKASDAAIHVAGDAPKSPAFTLYFAVAPRS